MNKWIFICLTIATGLPLGRATSPYAPDFMPAGVQIGDSEFTDTLTKQGLIKKVVKNRAGDAIIGSDLVERINRNTIGLYYIRNGELAGYMRTFNKLYADSSQIESETKLIIPNKNSGLIKDTDEDILRTDSNLKAKVVNARKWISPDNKFNLYAVISDLEVSGVIFNTRLMSKHDFFISADKKADIGDNLDKMRNASAPNIENNPAHSRNETGINFKLIAMSCTLIAVVILARYIIINKP